MDPLGTVTDDIDASFFETPSDPFDNDDDLVKPVKQVHGPLVYEDEVGGYEEDEEVYDDDDDDGINLADSEKDDEAGKDVEYEEDQEEDGEEDAEYEYDEEEEEEDDGGLNPHTFTLGSDTRPRASLLVLTTSLLSTTRLLPTARAAHGGDEHRSRRNTTRTQVHADASSTTRAKAPPAAWAR